MTKERSALLASLFDKKTVEVLKKLLRKKDIFYLRDLSRETGVSLATTYRIVQKLMKIGLVSKEKKDKFTFYTLLRHSPVYEELHSLVIGAVQDPLQLLKSILEEKYSNFNIYTTKGKDKKIFVISEHIKPKNIDTILDQIVEKTGVKLSCLIFAPFQFEQMKSAGLITKDTTQI